MQIADSDLRVASRIWGEVAEFPVASIDAALDHALREVAHAIGASNAFWIGARRENEDTRIADPSAWRIVRISYLDHSAERAKFTRQQAERFAAGEVDPQTVAIIAHAGNTRAHLRHELVDDRTWKRSWLYNDILRPLHVGDRLLGTHTIDAHAESYVGFERETGEDPFGERERDFLGLFLAGAHAFHRDLLRALAPARELTPREHDVLCLLLTGMSEREIAWQLFLTPRTTHQYVVAILRKFSLHGRVELMAHFLRS
jgi:DNA-binding CsgD family transcriptional regulator